VNTGSAAQTHTTSQHVHTTGGATMPTWIQTMTPHYWVASQSGLALTIHPVARYTVGVHCTSAPPCHCPPPPGAGVRTGCECGCWTPGTWRARSLLWGSCTAPQLGSERAGSWGWAPTLVGCSLPGQHVSLTLASPLSGGGAAPAVRGGAQPHPPEGAAHLSCG
jgi:hypothetical protein